MACAKQLRCARATTQASGSKRGLNDGIVWVPRRRAATGGANACGTNNALAREGRHAGRESTVQCALQGTLQRLGYRRQRKTRSSTWHGPGNFAYWPETSGGELAGPRFRRYTAGREQDDAKAGERVEFHWGDAGGAPPANGRPATTTPARLTKYTRC